jgi:2-polyprenyl-3-methyl-5-hydroxy-6-metoxy-1,4-benzoquinol methylase
MMKTIKINSSYKKQYEDHFRLLLKESDHKTYYDDGAFPSYTHKNGLIRWIFWKRIISALSLEKDFRNKAVLDFGCGGGVIFKYLNEYNCEITGCDNRYASFTRELSMKLNIRATIYKDLEEIQNKKFDYIFALDVLEHIDDIASVIDKLHELSHNKTIIILSGPTENYLYKIGRYIAGFSGHYHKSNIHVIENKFKEKGYKMKSLIRLFPVVTLFEISSWRR